MLYELIYRSDAVPNISEKDIENILSTARDFNEANEITGCLLFNNNQFLQLLEGEFDIVMALYDRIKEDPRHQNHMTLQMRETDYRIYPSWTMAFQSMDKSQVKSKVGVTEFTEFEADKDSALPKQLFEAVSHNMT
ncbi:MAG: hypothetical protein ACJAVN_001878 [Roseivirga sp.]|jgi:hypothetical protein